MKIMTFVENRKCEKNHEWTQMRADDSPSPVLNGGFQGEIVAAPTPLSANLIINCLSYSHIALLLEIDRSTHKDSVNCSFAPFSSGS